MTRAKRQVPFRKMAFIDQDNAARSAGERGESTTHREREAGPPGGDSGYWNSGY